jgi:hypothetical protein
VPILKKQGPPQINNLMMYLKLLEKKNEPNPKPADGEK